MPLVTWDSSFEIGIDIIDWQHKRIVSYVNGLHDAIIRRDGAAVCVMLDCVTDYILTHFVVEENMMEWSGYEHAEAHCATHRAFASRIGDYGDRLGRGEEIAEELLSEVTAWLTTHIKHEDQRMGDKLRAYVARE